MIFFRFDFFEMDISTLQIPYVMYVETISVVANRLYTILTFSKMIFLRCESYFRFWRKPKLSFILLQTLLNLLDIILIDQRTPNNAIEHNLLVFGQEFLFQNFFLHQ